MYEYIVKDARDILLLWSHWVMFPDWRYFAVDLHSCEMFNNLYDYWKIRKNEKDKYNEMIWIDKDWFIEDYKKTERLKEILIRNWFIMVQWWFEFWTKLHYEKINQDQRNVFNNMWIHIDESKATLLWPRE